MEVSVNFSGRRGILLLVCLVAGCFVAPRLITPLPVPAEVEAAVRARWAREVMDRWRPLQQGMSPESARAVSVAMASDLVANERRTVTALQVRRGWIGPPFARRWTYFIRLVEAPRGQVSFYRMAWGFVTPASLTAWRLRIL